MASINSPSSVPKDIEHLAALLDNRFKLPLGLSIGLDGLLGLVPGIGDLVTNSLSFYILYRAIQLGVTIPTLSKMIKNIVYDNVADIVPVLGNLFDIFWKSNLKNVELIQEDLDLGKIKGKRSFSQQLFLIIWIIISAIIVTLVSILGVIYSFFFVYKQYL